MSNKKYEQRYVTSISFEKKIFDGVNENLPRGVDISDEINAFLKERLEQLTRDKQKKGKALEENPLNLPKANCPETTVNSNIKNTLDLYMDYRQIIEHIKTVDDINRLSRLQKNGQIMLSVARTKKLRMLKQKELFV